MTTRRSFFAQLGAVIGALWAGKSAAWPKDEKIPYMGTKIIHMQGFESGDVVAGGEDGGFVHVGYGFVPGRGLVFWDENQRIIGKSVKTSDIRSMAGSLRESVDTFRKSVENSALSG